MRAIRTVPALLTLIAVAALGACTTTTDGQGLYVGLGPGPTSPSSSDPDPSPATTDPTAASTSTASTTTAAPPTTTAAPPPPTTSQPPPTSSPSGDGLRDDDWVVETFDYGDNGIGLFDGTARIRNDAVTSRSALYTFTLFDGESIVATFIGTSSEVAAGDTVTATLVSGDTYVEGEFSVDFQVDFSF